MVEWDNMNYEYFMKIAIEEAKKGDFPFGAVIVKNDKIISKSHNTLKKLDPTAHAEVNAIRKACKNLKTRNLSGCHLFVVAEPCPMCFIISVRVGISKIVYGVELEDIPKNIQRKEDFKCSFLNKKLGNKISIVSGILKEECKRLYL